MIVRVPSPVSDFSSELAYIDEGCILSLFVPPQRKTQRVRTDAKQRAPASKTQNTRVEPRFPTFGRNTSLLVFAAAFLVRSFLLLGPCRMLLIFLVMYASRAHAAAVTRPGVQ